MRLAAVTSCLAERGAEEAMRVIAGAGYSGVEYLVSSTLMPEDAPPERRRAIRSLAANLGLAVVGANGVLPATGHRFLVDDAAERQRGVDQMRRVIDLCADIGGGVVTVGSPGARNIPAGMAQEAWLPRAVAAFQAWAAHAEGRGVSVALEIINRYEGNWGRTIAEGLAFLEAANQPNLGLTIDSFHMGIDEEPFAEALPRGGSRILNVHVADSNRQAPGLGNLDFGALLRCLKGIGYQGFLSVELFDPWYGIDLKLPAEASLRLGRETLQRALAAADAE
jgi:sugar phosphate isomerase/epimerase